MTPRTEGGTIPGPVGLVAPNPGPLTLDGTRSYVVGGARVAVIDPGPASCRGIVLPFPIIDNDDVAKILHINLDGDLPGFQSLVVSGRYRVAGGASALRKRLDEICAEVSEAIDAIIRGHLAATR